MAAERGAAAAAAAVYRGELVDVRSYLAVHPRVNKLFSYLRFFRSSNFYFFCTD
jgi:hypothetical protein